MQPIFNQLTNPASTTNILSSTLLPYPFEEKPQVPPKPAYTGRSICGPKLRLVEFSAYQEQQEAESVCMLDFY